MRSGQAATPAAKHLWGYRDSKNSMCGVRRSHMRPEPYHDDLHTFRRETERSRHCRNEGWIRAVAESHCRHDMTMTWSGEKLILLYCPGRESNSRLPHTVPSNMPLGLPTRLQRMSAFMNNVNSNGGSGSLNKQTIFHWCMYMIKVAC